MQVSEVWKCMGEKVLGGNSAGEAELEQQGLKSMLCTLRGSGELREVADQRATRS